MSIIREMIDCGTWRERRPSANKLWLKRRPSIDGESIAGGWGRARGLTGGAFMGTLLAKQGDGEWVNPYVTNGLICMWDGEWNAGGGRHITSGSEWTDCIGGYSFSLTPFVMHSFGDAYVKIRQGHNSFSTVDIDDVGDASHLTVEVRCRAIQPATNGYMSPIAGSQRCAICANSANNGTDPHEEWGYQSGSNRLYKGRSRLYSYATYASTSDGSLFACNGETVTSFKFSTSFAIADPPERLRLMACTNPNMTNFEMDIYSVRVYNRILSLDEMQSNYAVDVDRFGLT